MSQRHLKRFAVHTKQFRLISGAMLFVMLITCFVSFYFYNINVQEQRQKREERIENLAEVYLSEFQKMGQLVRHLNNSRLVDDLRYETALNEAALSKYQALIQSLKLIEASYSWEVRPFVYFHNSGALVSADGKMRMDLLSQEFDLYGLDLEQFCRNTSREIQVIPRIGVYYSTNYAIRQQSDWCTLYLYTLEDVSVLALAGNASVNSMLSVAAQQEDSLFAIYDGVAGRVILSNSDGLLGETFMNPEAVSSALREQHGRMALTFRERGRFAYFLLENKAMDEIVSRQINVFLWMTATIGLIFVVLYALLLRREVFRPLNSILKKLPVNGPLNGDYDAIEDAIFNMQGRIRGLTESMQEASRKEREGRMRQIMLGAEPQSALKAQENSGCFAVVSLSGELDEEMQPTGRWLRERFHAELEASIQDQQIYLIGFERPEEYEQFLQAVEALDDGEESRRIALGVSRLCDDLSRIRQAYQESCDAIHAWSDEDRLPVLYAAGRDRTDFSVSTPMDVNESGMLLSTIANGDVEAAVQLVTDILEARRPRTIAQNRYVAIYMLNVLSMAQNSCKQNVFELTMLVSRIRRMVDAPAMRCMVVEACRALTQSFSGTKEDALICAIRQYVEEHYAENIYLKTVAERIGLSYAYVSHYFSERQGVAFTDYLNSVRVEKACAMLKKRDRSLNEIAESVGFGSMNTFVRNMKKFTGMTPDAYRKAHSGS